MVGQFLVLQPRKRKVNKFAKNLSKTCKFDPEGTRGPIGPEVIVLEPWHPGHHASTKKIVDLTSSVFDLFGASASSRHLVQNVLNVLSHVRSRHITLTPRHFDVVENVLSHRINIF